MAGSILPSRHCESSTGLSGVMPQHKTATPSRQFGHVSTGGFKASNRDKLAAKLPRQCTARCAPRESGLPEVGKKGTKPRDSGNKDGRAVVCSRICAYMYQWPPSGACELVTLEFFKKGHAQHHSTLINHFRPSDALALTHLKWDLRRPTDTTGTLPESSKGMRPAALFVKNDWNELSCSSNELGSAAQGRNTGKLLVPKKASTYAPVS